MDLSLNNYMIWIYESEHYSEIHMIHIKALALFIYILKIDQNDKSCLLCLIQTRSYNKYVHIFKISQICKFTHDCHC